MITGTYTMTVSGVNVVLHVSVVSATIAQMALGDQLWRRLLGGVNASAGAVKGSSAPAATVTTVQVGSGSEDAQGGRL
jgi:hypothetical protein